MNKTADLWKDVRGAHFFITGGSGFFGHWLVESFLYANRQFNLKASASILSRKPESTLQTFSHLLPDPAITIVEGDIRNFIFPKGDYTHILHAATDSGSDPFVKLDTIIDGTRHILDFAVQCKAEKFLFTSSGAVYGKQPSNMTHIPEEFPGAPDAVEVSSLYGNGKRIAELLCSLYSKQFGIDTMIARCFAFVGSYLPLDANYAIGNFIRDALKGSSIQINGDGTPYRSYLYAADLAIWLWTILLKGRSVYPYNVGSETDLTIAQLARCVTKELAPTATIQIAKEPISQQPASRYVPSTQRARQDLKLETWIPLDEAIRRTADFYKR